MVIAVDFDGTCVTHEFPQVGKDIGAVPVLKRLVSAGHQIILYTMRDDVHRVCRYQPFSACDSNILIPDTQDNTFGMPTVLQVAVDWFRKNSIPLLGANCNPQQHTWSFSNKVYANVYIDDAALGTPLICDPNISSRPFVDWQKVERILEEQGLI